MSFCLFVYAPSQQLWSWRDGQYLQRTKIMTETNSFMSLLRAQLVANNHWFPYMDSEPGTQYR